MRDRRMLLVQMPALRPPPAVRTTKEDCPRFAADAVIVSNQIAAEPVPHDRSPRVQTASVSTRGNCSATTPAPRRSCASVGEEGQLRRCWRESALWRHRASVEGLAREITDSSARRAGSSARAAASVGQFIEQGPFGSPHRPHPPLTGPGTSRLPAPADTANTDSCFSSAWLLQPGHSASRELDTIVSKAWPQSRQTYSKIGMDLV